MTSFYIEDYKCFALVFRLCLLLLLVAAAAAVCQQLLLLAVHYLIRNFN